MILNFPVYVTFIIFQIEAAQKRLSRRRAVPRQSTEQGRLQTVWRCLLWLVTPDVVMVTLAVNIVLVIVMVIYEMNTF